MDRAEVWRTKIRIATLYAEFRTKGLGKFHAGLKTAHGSLVKMDAALVRVGRVSRTAFIGMAAAAGVAIHAAVGFEKSMAMVSTMLDKGTMKHLPAYKKGIQELSVQMGESTATLSKGLYDILSASIAPAKAMDVLAVAAKAAVGGITDTATAASAIVGILNSYSMSADRAGEVADKLQAAVKLGQMTYEELAASVGKASAITSIAGVSLEEFLATISTITKMNIKADVAMTSVVGILQAFLKPTDEGAAAAKKLGFELNTATLKAEGLSGVFKKLIGLKAEDLSKIFPNLRGLKGIAAAMKDQAGYAKAMALQMDAAGLADEAFNKMSGTTAFQLGQLKQEVSALAKDIGNALMPAFKDMLKGIQSFIGTLGANGIATFIKWGLALTAIGMILPKITSGVLLLSKAIGALSKAMLFLIANPVVLAIAAIVIAIGALVYAIYKINAIRAEQNKTQTNTERTQGEVEKQAKGEGLMTELTSITNREKLTNYERVRAVELAKELTAMYGNLGFTVDKATGKIRNMAKAQERLTESMKGVMLRRLGRELKEEYEKTGDKGLSKKWWEIRKKITKTQNEEKYLSPAMKERMREGKFAEEQLANTAKGLGSKYAVTRTKAEETALVKNIINNQASAIQDTQMAIAAKSGDAAATHFGLKMEYQTHQANVKAQKVAAEEAFRKGKITEKEWDAQIDSINKMDAAKGASLSERTKQQKGIFGEGGVKVDYDKGTWKGLAEVWRDMQSSIMKKDPQTEELKKQTKFLETLPKILEKIGTVGAVAQ